MLKNYLKVAIRNILKQKVYSLINITGLAVGLALFILSLLYADFNFSYDKFHENSESIFCLTKVSKSGSHDVWVPAAMLKTLVEEVPGVEDGTRLSGLNRKIVRYLDKKFYEPRIWYADENFLSVFSFRMIKGDSRMALAAPNTVVITESIAQKYFGSENPIGKNLMFDDDITEDGQRVRRIQTDRRTAGRNVAYDSGPGPEGALFLGHWSAETRGGPGARACGQRQVRDQQTQGRRVLQARQGPQRYCRPPESDRDVQ